MKLLVRILGRDLSWRIGRALYMTARGEGLNDMSDNGEALLVHRVVTSIAAERRQAPAVVVDCGANLGEWTAMAQASFDGAKVAGNYHMMEPSPQSNAAISARFSGDDRVTVHAVALSDRDGEAEFHLVSPTGGTNSLIATETSAAQTITVKVARGAAYFSALGIGGIDLLKIDTEGHDFAVIEGFAEMLEAKAIKVIQFEYNFRWLASGRAMRNIFEAAERYGYRVGRANGSGIDVYDCWNAENDRFFEWNYLLIAPEMVESLGAREMRWGPSNTLIPA